MLWRYYPKLELPDDDAKGKGRDKAPGASASHLPKKKKKGRQGKQEVLEADLVAAADRKNPQGHQGPRALR